MASVKYRLLLLLQFFLLWVSGNGQAELDSLYLVLETAPEHEVPALFAAIGVQYLRMGDFRQAKSALDTAANLIEPGQDNLLLAKLANNRAIAESYLGNTAQSISLQKQALDLYLEIGDDSLTGQAYLSLGLAYKRIDAFSKAMAFLTKAEEIFEPERQFKDLAATYNALGNIQKELNRYDQAIVFHRKALNLRKQIHHQDGIAKSLHSLGQLYLVQDSLNQARQHFEAAIEIKRAVGGSNLLASSISQLALVCIEENKLVEAKKLIVAALMLRKQSGDKKGLAAAWGNRAQWALASLLYDSAMIFADSGLAYSMAINDLSVREGLLEVKMQSLRNARRYEEALVVSDTLTGIRNNLLNQAHIQVIERLRVEFEVGKQELRIEQQRMALQQAEQQNRTLWLFALISVIVALIVAAFWRQSFLQRQKIAGQNRQLDEAKENAELLHKELVHRTKNNFEALNGVFSIQQANTNTKEAKEVVADLSRRLQAMSIAQQKLNLSDVQQLGVSIAPYIQDLMDNALLSFNLDREQVKTTLSLVQQEIDFDVAMRVGLITNELITNALKNLDLVAPALCLTLCVDEATNNWVLTVTNSAIVEKAEVTEGTGLSLVRALVGQLNGSFTYQIRNTEFVAEATFRATKNTGQFKH